MLLVVIFFHYKFKQFKYQFTYAVRSLDQTNYWYLSCKQIISDGEMQENAEELNDLEEDVNDADEQVSGEIEGENNSNNETSTKKRLTKAEKKQLARERYRQMLHAARERKRQRKKEEKKLQNADRPAFRPDERDTESNVHFVNEDRKIRKQQELRNFLKKCDLNFEVILDCAWEKEHNSQALTSLIQQISYCYGANRKTPHPCIVRLFGMGPEMKEKLRKVNCANWKGFHAYDEDFTAHINDWYSLESVISPSVSCVTAGAAVYSTEVPDNAVSEDVDIDLSVPTRKRQLVYLTSDAEETLEKLDSNCTYVIGGIVDRNRLKGVTYHKACSHKIRTAKLPIKEWFTMSATHILTVNHVFEIMLNFQETRSWIEAMNMVLPKRKEAKLITDEEEGGRHDDNHDQVDDHVDKPSSAKRPRYSTSGEDCAPSSESS